MDFNSTGIYTGWGHPAFRAIFGKEFSEEIAIGKGQMALENDSLRAVILPTDAGFPPVTEELLGTHADAMLAEFVMMAGFETTYRENGVDYRGFCMSLRNGDAYLIIGELASLLIIITERQMMEDSMPEFPGVAKGSISGNIREVADEFWSQYD
jgi:hypothetical protein